jgi:two-component system, OmpR family, response regulator RegX3
MRASILLVEDEPVTAELVGEALRGRGYETRWVGTGAEALSAVGHVAPDLVLVDLMLPDMDGLVLCANLRHLTDAPIIIGSGTQRQWEAVVGLKLGADDFVPKPFDLDELEARVEAALRRQRRRAQAPPPPPRPQTRLGALKVDRRSRRITVDDQALRLSAVEFELLSVLISRPNETVSRAQLARAAWGAKYQHGERSVEGRIRRLRTKLGGAPSDLGLAIVAVRGSGYKLVERG